MAQYYEAFNSRLDSFLNEKNTVTNLLDKAEKATGVKKAYIAQGALGFVGLYMIFGYFASLICNLVGFVYPAYASIHSLESHDSTDDTKWLTYWVVFAFFSNVEFFSDIIFSWFPFYWLAKVVFLIWCFLPITNNGSMVIYHRLIRPVFIKNKGNIDAGFDKAAGFAGKVLSEAQKLGQKAE